MGGVNFKKRLNKKNRGTCFELSQLFEDFLFG